MPLDLTNEEETSAVFAAILVDDMNLGLLHDFTSVAEH